MERETAKEERRKDERSHKVAIRCRQLRRQDCHVQFVLGERIKEGGVVRKSVPFVVAALRVHGQHFNIIRYFKLCHLL